MTHTDVAYSITIRAEYPNEPGMLGKITSSIGEAGGDVTGVDVVKITKGIMTRDFTINTGGGDHSETVLLAVKSVTGVKVRSLSDPTFLIHLGGKISMQSTKTVTTRDDMSKVYTPGVGRVCMAIHKDPSAVWTLTTKGSTVAIVSDGSAVLGLGDIGPEASLPVMEGKALLFKQFGGVDAWPIVLNTKDPDEIIAIVTAIAPGFGGINLEDISAPRCFYIEDELRKRLDIPVFHDDQHGTAVVVLAGLINALKLLNKRPEELRMVVLGVGASGMASSRILMRYGIKNIVGFDRSGPLSKERDYGNNPSKQWFADHTNPNNFTGSLEEALTGADFLLGLAGPGLITSQMTALMAENAIIFALSNPVPEILPEEVSANIRIMATGRTDYPNQVNNSLCFPGLFRGVLNVRASAINDDMKIAAAEAIANVIPEDHLSEDFIIPSVFNERVAQNIAERVAAKARECGLARRGASGMSNDYTVQNFAQR